MVSYSQYSFTPEQLSYVAISGYYFLRIVPYIPSTTASYHQFVINISAKYDSAEADDNAFFAKPYTNKLNVNQTIDNYLDEDWFKLTITQKKDYQTISLNNVPAGAQYAFYILDSNLGALGSFVSFGSESRNYPLNIGTYYIKVTSYNGASNANQSYNLKVEPSLYYPSISDGQRYLLPNGNTLEVSDKYAYVEGKRIIPSWTYFYENNVWKLDQSLNTTADTRFVADEYQEVFKYGQYTGKDVSCSQTIRLNVTNVWFHYRYYQFVNGGGSIVDAHDEDINFSDIFYIYVDASTGKVIDVGEWNYYYRGRWAVWAPGWSFEF